MSNIKRIPIEKLEIGMYVTDHSNGIADGKMQEKGFIRRPETLAKIRKKDVAELFIDVNKGKDSAFAIPVLSKDTKFKTRVKLSEERERAEKVYGEARGLVDDLLQDVKMGKAIDVAPVADLAEDINNSILNNQNALLCLSQIREKDKYLLEHSINVGILMSVFSTHLGYSKAIVKELTTGALLHDIGKIRVPSEILNKPGRLTAEEWEEMKRHVTYGEETLLKSPGISNIAKSICAQHHERLDASGYPRNLPASDIDVFGRISAIVDVYDAITASRVYHDGMTPFDGMKFLVGISDNHLDKGLVYNFIRCMSVYPVGTTVELSNGKAGIVVQANESKPDRPRLSVFYNLRHKHFEEVKHIDLSASGVEVKIIRTINPEDHEIDVKEFL